MAYIKIIYQNSPSTATPINAENLNHMDDQIALNDQRLTDLEGAHVSSFNGRTGAVSPTDGDYNIGQIAPLAGATVGQVPVVVNVGTEEDPKLEFAMGQGGGGGHVIVDQSGNALDQEPNMTFLDAHLSDNSTDESTDIELIQSVSESDWESATEDGFYDVDIEGVEISSASDEYVEVEADGTKTYAQLLNDLHSLIDTDKLKENSYIDDNGDALYAFTAISGDVLYFGGSDTLTGAGTIYRNYITVRTSGSALRQVTINTNNTVNSADQSSGKPTEGHKLTLYYGNKYSVIDLQTKANRCLLNSGETVESALTVKTLTITNVSIPADGYITDLDASKIIILSARLVADSHLYAPLWAVSGTGKHIAKLYDYSSGGWQSGTKTFNGYINYIEL